MRRQGHGADLQDFGADPSRPQSLAELSQELMERQSIDPVVCVVAEGTAVVAVEFNGWQGADETVLELASAGSPDVRAASMYWSVNAHMRLGFAQGGRLLASFDPLLERLPDEVEHPAVVAATGHLRPYEEDEGGDTVGQGLLAVQRFTGRTITADDIDHVLRTGVGFRIVPHLPRLYPYVPIAQDYLPYADREPLHDRLDRLTALPPERARDLAWWIAAETARGCGLADDPDVAATLDARDLPDTARWRARRAQLDDGEHPWLWQTLHRATNPDPVAAVLGVVDAGRYAVGPRAAGLIAAARDRLDSLVSGA